MTDTETKLPVDTIAMRLNRLAAYEKLPWGDLESELEALSRDDQWGWGSGKSYRHKVCTLCGGKGPLNSWDGPISHYPDCRTVRIRALLDAIKEIRG